MENSIEKAVQGSKQQAEAFERLGLNVGELSKLSPDQKFEKIADAIRGLQSPQERINAEMAIFGKTGAALGPLLDQGTAGIEKMGDEADRLHVTLNDVDAAKVLEANNSLAQLQDVIEGVENQILVDLAPLITDISERIKRWLLDGNVVKNGLQAVWRGIGLGVGLVADVLKLGESALDAFGAVGASATYVVVQAFDDFAHQASWVLEHVFGKKLDTSGFDAAADKILSDAKRLGKQSGQEFSDAWSGASAAKAMEWFDQVQKEEDERAKQSLPAAGAGHEPTIEEHAKKTGGWLSELGKLGESAWKKIEGAVGEAAKKAEEESKRLDEEAKSLLQSFATPLEKEREKIAEVEKLYASGHLTADQKNTLESRIQVEFNKDNVLTPKAVTAGSQEAFALIDQINSRVAKQGTNSVADKQLTESKKQTGLLKNLVDKRGGVDLKLAMI